MYSGVSVGPSVLIFCFNLVLLLLYFYTINESNDLTVKQRAHVLSVKATAVLMLISGYFVFVFAKSGLSIPEYTSGLTDNERFFSVFTVLFFMAYLVADIVVGFNFYPGWLTCVSGYLHHIVYLVWGAQLLHMQRAELFILFMLMEIPTFIQSVGRSFDDYKSTTLFGVSFFLMRIVYHMYMIMQIWDVFILREFAILAFIIHCLWFYDFIKARLTADFSDFVARIFSQKNSL